jgi:hypothetical protein
MAGFVFPKESMQPDQTPVHPKYAFRQHNKSVPPLFYMG